MGYASFIALKHDELFAACVFAVFAAYCLKQNWSFEVFWREQINTNADASAENSFTLILNDEGVIEKTSGMELKVRWQEIRDYREKDGLLFICILKNRGFIIPLRHLSESQREELVSTLESHGIKKRNDPDSRKRM